jgi:hypothetical protein
MIGFGNYQRNTMLVTHGDGYDEYRGLGDGDIYNVNPALTDDVTISDVQGRNLVVLGETDIDSVGFLNNGVVFHYKSGGSLTVIGSRANFRFVFGGGTDPFEPTEGGTEQSFDETAEDFGVDPNNLSDTEVTEGTVSGTISADGTVLETGFEVSFLSEEVTEGDALEFMISRNSDETASEVNWSVSGVTLQGEDNGTAVFDEQGQAVVTVITEDDTVDTGDRTLSFHVTGELPVSVTVLENDDEEDPVDPYTAVSMENGGTYEAQDDVAEAFVYAFTDADEGLMEGRNGTVTITGFDAESDMIRFVDTDGEPPELAEFQSNGYSVTPNAFAGQTVVSLQPDMSSGSAVASDIILQGVVITETDIQIEVI